MTADDIAKARAVLDGYKGGYADLDTEMIRVFRALAKTALDEVERVADRVTTICDEACGLQPVQSVDESLSAIERKLFEQRRDHTNLLTRLRALIDGTETP